MGIFDRRITLVTGKGGVGRTTVAVALARAAAAEGRHVLLTEVGDPEGGDSLIGRGFGRRRLQDVPETVVPRIDICRLWGLTGHEMFARSVIPAGPLVSAALRSKALQRFMIAAPSFHELGILYHFLRLAELRDARGAFKHDLIVVDMPASGHTMALASLPEAALRLMPRGPVAEAMLRGQRLINDARTTGAWLVTLPEPLPVSEALELGRDLRATKVPVAGVYLNRFHPDSFDPEERQAAIELLAAHALRGQIEFDRISLGRDALGRLIEGAGAPVLTLPDVPPVAVDPVPALVAALRAIEHGPNTPPPVLLA